MKKALSYLILLLLSSCGTIENLDSNLEHSIHSVDQNTQAVDRSQQAIAKNTEVVSAVTSTMRSPGFFVLLVAIFGLFAALILSFFTLLKIQKSLVKLINKKN